MLVEENNDWQLECGMVRQRGGRLLAGGQWADCGFLLGPDDQLQKAHKLLLAMASPVFQAMFYGPLTEVDAPIPIPDIRPEVFLQLLQYIYTDQIDLGSYTIAIDLFYAAQKYMLRRLQRLCTTYLSRNLSPQNASCIYEFAYVIGDKKLECKSLKVIKANTKLSLSDTSFENLSLATVISIFSMDDITIDSELDLLDAAERYYLAQQEIIDEKSSNVILPDLPQPENDSKVLDDNADKILMAHGNEIKHNEEDKKPGVENQATSSDTPLGYLDIEAEDNNRARPDATIRYIVHNFMDLDDSVSFPPFYVRDLPWEIEVIPGCNENYLKQLSAALKCKGASNCSSWSCKAKAKLRLVPVLPDTKPTTIELQKLFCSKDASGGLDNFIMWDEDAEDELDVFKYQEYIKNRSITLEVHVTAEEPEGVPLSMKKLAEIKDVSIRTLVNQIRFLTLSASQLAKYKPKSSLLSQNDILALMMNITTSDTYMPLPEGFSRCKQRRTPMEKK